jgi:hypothetical protein
MLLSRRTLLYGLGATGVAGSALAMPRLFRPRDPRAVTSVVAWLPTALLLNTVYRLLLRPKIWAKPGAIPEALADAMRHASPHAFVRP